RRAARRGAAVARGALRGARARDRVPAPAGRTPGVQPVRSVHARVAGARARGGAGDGRVGLARAAGPGDRQRAGVGSGRARRRGVGAAHALEGVTELTLSYALAMRRLRPTLTLPTRASLLGYWRYARPLLVNVPLGLVQDSLDRVLVKQWAGLEAAGFYHVARGLWETLASLSAYPTMVLFPRLSRVFAERSAAAAAEARSLFFSAVEKLLFVSVPLGLGLWFFAEPLITTLFAPSFAPAVAATRIFVLAVIAA